ncbi:MAG: site-specific tyrosine recombinase/integron integrase [Thermoplasmata archaeon]
MRTSLDEKIESDVAQSFRNRLYANGKSKNTVKMYGYIAQKYLEFIKFDRRKITRESIEDFKEYLSLELGYSKTSIYLYVRALQAFLDFLEIKDLGSLNPPKRPQKVPNYLVETEVSKILDSCRNSKEKLIVELLAYTGVRVSELCSIRVNDIDLENKSLKIRGGKGDKDRLVIFSDKIVPDLKIYIMEIKERRGKSEFLFPTAKSRKISPVTVERIIRNLAKRAGINKKVTPHVLRHTFATSLLRNGADIRIIQVLLGHASISTTQIYTHVDDGALRRSYEKYAPSY